MKHDAWEHGPDHAGGHRSSKGFDDYARALRRRSWLVVLIMLAIGAGGTAFTLSQRPVYWANSRILIEAPRAIVEGLDHGQPSTAMFDHFFNSRVQMISSRQIAERVLAALHLSDWEELHGVEDPVAELSGWIKVKPVQNSDLVDIGLEGTDPELVAKIVNSTVDEFVRYESESLQEFDQVSRSRIDSELRGLEAMANSTRQALSDFHKDHKNFLLTGESVESAKLAILEEAKAQAELRLDSAKRAVDRFEALRRAGVPYFPSAGQEKVGLVREQIRLLDEELGLQKDIIRAERYENDRAIRGLLDKKKKLEDSLNGLGQEEAEYELKRLQQEREFASLDLKHLQQLVEQQRKQVLGQQDDHSRLASMQSENTRVNNQREFIAIERLKLDLRQGLVTPRIQVIDRAAVPRLPVRPIKELQIPLSFVVGLLLGCVSVIGLEMLDHSIRSPEQAMAALPLPLLGVLPTFPRRGVYGKGGRLQLEEPRRGSPMFEAFRTLRGGVLSAEQEEPLRSLLITSAKPGEGKSMVAAQLAAACARAGENVLLIDLDLRRPSQGRLFGLDPSAAGIAEVLDGSTAWRDALHPTELPRLWVMPSGDAHRVSIDILGTVEMFDLLNDAQSQFDRVILDAPAMLGMADARMVGRFADGVLLVIRAGTRDGRPLHRIRQLFEQDQLRPVGLVFNGLRGGHDDLATHLPATTAPARSARSARSARRANRASKESPPAVDNASTRASA